MHPKDRATYFRNMSLEFQKRFGCGPSDWHYTYIINRLNDSMIVEIKLIFQYDQNHFYNHVSDHTT
jgi:hypothetical protein